MRREAAADDRRAELRLEQRPLEVAACCAEQQVVEHLPRQLVVGRQRLLLVEQPVERDELAHVRLLGVVGHRVALLDGVRRADTARNRDGARGRRHRRRAGRRRAKVA